MTPEMLEAFQADLVNACRRFAYHRRFGPAHEITFALDDIVITVSALGYNDTKGSPGDGQTVLPPAEWDGPIPGQRPHEAAEERIKLRRQAVGNCQQPTAKPL